jgi:hypothetical protein
MAGEDAAGRLPSSGGNPALGNAHRPVVQPRRRDLLRVPGGATVHDRRPRHPATVGPAVYGPRGNLYTLNNAGSTLTRLLAPIAPAGSEMSFEAVG